MVKLRVFIQDHMTSFRTIIACFLALILAGAVLLSLPVSSADHMPTRFTDALFTSASAACVTGLVVFDTATKWSVFGKAVILILIQIGGLGVITAIIATRVLTGKKIGILSRITMQDSVSAPQAGGIVRFTIFFLLGTLAIEGAGTLLLMPVFIRDFGIAKGFFYSLFHSVSAFCNAGFDLMGIKAPFSSLTSYAESIPVNLIICSLIILGGIGFLTWSDLIRNRFRFKRLRLQSKIILSSTLFLILIPFLYFYFIEFKGMPELRRILLSLFQSVTPRTAGFNTANYAAMSESSLLITIILMLIGGAPGSTAGGMKVTTIAVVMLAANACLHRERDTNCFRRRIESEVIHNAMTLAAVYLFLLICGTLLISTIEKLPLIQVMFECASALGTVGLTTGITPHLCVFSKMLLTGFMFFGRVGGLTLAYAMVSTTAKMRSRYPVEKITVG